MNPEMQAYFHRLVILMREGLERWPEHGILLILKAERQVVSEDPAAIAAWASARDPDIAPGTR